MTEPGGFLSDADAKTIILALAAGMPDGFTEKQAVKALRWAEKVIIGQAMLDLVLDGKCNLSFKGGKVAIARIEVGK